MIIGIPKEIKEKEYRVAITPDGVDAFAKAGHQVLIETGAGLGSSITDLEYATSGATMVDGPQEVWAKAEMIMKVKEPLPPEYERMREDQILFTYLHLSPLPDLTQQLLDKKIIGVAYETVQIDDGYLPLLTPMSEVAGRMAVQAGAHFLEKENGGRGVLLGGVPGVERGHVTILGSGTVAVNAAQMAIGMEADVTMLGVDQKRLVELDNHFQGRLHTLFSNQQNIAAEIKKADLVIGAVLVPGGNAPRLITREMLKTMQKGAVIVDVAIDQGGCAETSRPTFHSDPVYVEEGILHYCVANMPGAVPRTSTFALTNCTLPYALDIADKGLPKAADEDASLARGVNVCQGCLTNKNVAESQGKEWQDIWECDYFKEG